MRCVCDRVSDLACSVYNVRIRTGSILHELSVHVGMRTMLAGEASAVLRSIMLGSVRALYCMSYRCMSVYGRCERDKIVLTVQMGAVSAVSAVGIERAVSTERAVSIERAVSSVGAEVAAQGLDGARVASVARGADHWGPRQSRSWDSWRQARVHGSQAFVACCARAGRACGACVAGFAAGDARRGRECLRWRGASRRRRALAGRGGGHGAPRVERGSGHVSPKKGFSKMRWYIVLCLSAARARPSSR